jgi:hypothetical protein
VLTLGGPADYGYHCRTVARFLCSAATLAFGVAFTAGANAATHQVGPGKAYAELSEVADLLQPGDFVELDGDATYTGGVAFWNAGAPNAKITIRGIVINGKRPVISGGTNTIEAAGNHYVFESLDITGGSFRCFYHHAHDVTLRDSVVHDCPAHGVLGADSDSGSLLRSTAAATVRSSIRSTWRPTRPRTPARSFACSTATCTTRRAATT